MYTLTVSLIVFVTVSVPVTVCTGGGQPLLENAQCRFIRGRRYGLIGRNGKGKSTLLRALAARRVGNIPPNVTVHYVSQEVKLSAQTQEMTPIEMVIAADLERSLLLEELASFEKLHSQTENNTAVAVTTTTATSAAAATAAAALAIKNQNRYSEVVEQLELISADTAERRAVELLDNLGFTDELKTRPMSALSGGWKVRTMLAAGE